jgi:hypothetical protein
MFSQDSLISSKLFRWLNYLDATIARIVRKLHKDSVVKWTSGFIWREELWLTDSYRIVLFTLQRNAGDAPRRDHWVRREERQGNEISFSTVRINDKQCWRRFQQRQSSISAIEQRLPGWPSTQTEKSSHRLNILPGRYCNLILRKPVTSCRRLYSAVHTLWNRLSFWSDPIYYSMN